MIADLPVTVEGDGPGLLCLHGGPGLSDYLATALGDETLGWRRICYTQRGLDNAVVLGHSWGGFLAVALATEHPDRVRGMLLVDPVGITGDGGYERFAEQILARTPEDVRVRADELDQRAMSGQGTEADALESMRLLWPAYFNDPPSAPPMPEETRLSIAGYSQALEDLMAILASGELPGRAASYGGPVELLYGLGSPLPVETQLETAHTFPRGSATGVPDAGHFPWLEQPGCVADALVRLAAQL
jgi:proline iminopeptidase